MTYELIKFNPTTEVMISKDSDNVAVSLRIYSDEHQLDVRILGPALPLVTPIQKSEIRHIVLKVQSPKSLHKLLKYLETIGAVSSAYVVMG